MGTGTQSNHLNLYPLDSECDSFDTTQFPGLIDLSSKLPVFTETVLTVKCEKPTRFAIISGDKTITCQHGWYQLKLVSATST